MQGCVGISVTVEAALELVMRLPHVAMGTFRDGLLYCRRMPDMASTASKAGVLSAGGYYVGRRTGVTLYAVIVCHRGPFLGSRHVWMGQKHGHSNAQK
jgi:hypothetical protein